MGRSFVLRDELSSLSDDIENYPIQNEHDPSSSDVAELLESTVERIAESSDSIAEAEVFDVFASLLKYSDSVPGVVFNKLLDSLSSGLQAEIEATRADIEGGNQQDYMSHKTPLEIYAFFFQFFASAVEKVKGSEDDEDVPAATAAKGKKGKGGKAGAGKATGRAGAAKKANEGWSWQSQIHPTLALITKVLAIPTQRIWVTTAERETFVNCITDIAYRVAENEQYMKLQDIKHGVGKVICLAVKNHNHAFAAQIAIMHRLQFCEHLSEFMAETLASLAKNYDHRQLGDEILREIANRNFSGTETKSTRSFAKFLVHFGDISPRSMLKQMSLLSGQLDSEAYPIRNAIVEILGFLIVELADGQAPREEDTQATLRQIEDFYEILLKRVLDVSSYVRAKVFTVFQKLCDINNSKFPKQRLQVAQYATGALLDKNASVRKVAIMTLVKLMVTHPHTDQINGPSGGELTKDIFLKGRDLVRAELGVHQAQTGTVPEEEEAENPNNDDAMDVDEDEKTDEDDEDENGEKPQKAAKPKMRKSISMADITPQVATAHLDNQKSEFLISRQWFFETAIRFIEWIEEASATVCQLLGSTSKAEVLEAIEFFRVAHSYKLECADVGIKKMLHLIWVKDNSSTVEDGKELKGIRSRLLDCYRTMFFDHLSGYDPKSQINRIAKNMIELTYNATLAELTSLEEMLRILMLDGQIDPDVIEKLWQIYGKNKTLPKPQRRGAIVILGMLALATRDVLKDRVDVMLKHGLGSRGKHDLTLARYTCVAFQRLNGSAKKIKGSLQDNVLRLDMDSAIFRKLEELLEQPCRSKEWFGLAEQAINTVYALGSNPDVFCNNLIKKFTTRVFSRKPRPATAQPPVEKDPDAMDEDPPEESNDPAAAETQDGQEKDIGDAFELSQLLFIVGHVAIKHIVYLELVEREWKRQKDDKPPADKAASGAAPKAVDELDQVVGNAEDDIGDRVATIREHELLYGPESLLAVYGPMLVHICGSPQIYKNQTLRAAATLSFSKFLCVSSQFCDENHRLLFKILETSKSASIRSNIVIALGDVAVSFSSIIDENSNELYKGLSDSDLGVKKNTLMVLTHLILNGMVKVKGQLGEMAKCLEDSDPRVADLAKLFFTELSTKENAIYNNLPDIISHLSIGEHAVDEATFQSTLKYIFSFIEKEKQAENIIEKLCQRFRLSEDPRQWRDIAFCLSLLPFKSERSVKKLTEGLPLYRDKLHEEGVYAKFAEILVKARQNKSPNKPDNELNDFEQILEEHKIQGEADQELEQRVKGKKGKKKAPKRVPRKKMVRIQEESDGADDE
ncbi:non-SMC mitotic condensation complex subunit 1-domain-containing protein [Mycena floridula]|nr:non-SMC mitotic condensation complex subunit 1-domain-containing protein [Mycena floridula]